MRRTGLYAGGIAVTIALLLGTACERKPVGAVTPQPSQGAPAPAGGREETSIPYGEAEVVADKLNVPWDAVFAPDGRLFFTERAGAIRVIENGRLAADPVFAFTDKPVVSRSESGLLGLTLDPDFTGNGYMYAYHTYEANGSLKNRVLRLKLEGGKAKLDRVLLDGLPGQQTHDGGRIRFGPDGLLYITVGDAQEREQSQSMASLAGKILRIRSDGSIPADNPDPKSPVYSLGHRNPQGLAWQPDTGRLFSSEHGQTAKDEINVIEKGGNYGWPLIEGDQTEPKQKAAGAPLRPPLLHSGADTTWAPSGMTFITQGPWKGQLLVANLRGMQVLKLTLAAGTEPKVDRVEPLWKERYGRLRSVLEGPDGSLYVLTNNRDGRGTPQQDDDRILRFRPQ
ncbi:PQQ-dependent sugar dehydrogenase [Paenibacillus hodogayensis]|uniref:PQQ-dependent sugar dehydrogenase n=1 Tax=Paenibacillus hodogayensis TaxID=279208 RepID=A0ABV5VQP2_9BACL